MGGANVQYERELCREEGANLPPGGVSLEWAPGQFIPPFVLLFWFFIPAPPFLRE